MQSHQMESFDQQREGYMRGRIVEQSLQKKFYRSWIDEEGKILPGTGQRKKTIYRLRLRILLALFSTLVFLLVVGGILVNSSQEVFPNLVNVDLLLTLVSYVAVNAIGNLLLDRTLRKIDRSKSVARRVIFTVASFFLAPILCWMMMQGYNGIDGILLVLVSTVVANSISYLTLCKKKRSL